MKTFVRISVFAAIVALVACSSHNASGKSVTVKSSDNTATVGSSVDPAQLGAPVYPGAKANKAGTVSYTGADAGVMAAFSTTDDFDKVYNFYKSKLPPDSEKMRTQSADGSAAEFIILGTGGDTSVQINGKSSLTEIVIITKAKN